MSQDKQEKQKKIMYIMEHVAEHGYDTTQFNKFLQDKYNGSRKIENMNFEQIVAVVSEYKKARDQKKPQLQKQKHGEQGPDALLERREEAMYNKMKKSSAVTETPFSRKTQITKSISGNNKTELNLKQVNMEVLKSEVVKSGLFSSDYVVFHVQTVIQDNPHSFTVQRKDSDFYTLRQVLWQQFPYTVVPSLPAVKQTKTAEKELRNRVQLYNRFLTGISRSEVLKSCKFVYQFLTVTDRKYWKIEKEGYEKLRFSRRIEDVICQEGQVSVEDRTDSKKFCDEVKNFTAVYSHLTKEAISLSKEVHEMSDQLALSTNRLASTIRDLGRLFKQMKVNSQFKLFTQLSELFKDTSLNLKNQGYLTKIYFGQAMKYYEQELAPLEEVVAFRESFRLDYAKCQKDLEDRKNQLFKQDPRNWGYTNGSLEDLVSKSQQLLKDKSKAFKFMLSSDTQKLQEMGEELSFYTNQCLDEVQRVGKDNGVALIDHFMDQGKIQCDYLQQQFDKQSEFVAYFGSLAWDKPVSEKRKKKRQQDEDFELIDDAEQVEGASRSGGLVEAAMGDNDYELVSVSDNTRASVRITQVHIDEEPVVEKPLYRATSGASGYKDIGETLKNMLSESVLSHAGPITSNQNSTEQTQTSEKSFLIAPPTVMISKKNKNSNNRRTAPLQLNQSQVPNIASQPAQTTASNQNRMTSPFTEGSNPDNQQSSGSMPMFAGSGSDPQVNSSNSDPVASSSTSKDVPLQQESIKDPASLDSGSHSSAQQPNMSSNRRSVGNLFAFDFQAHMSSPADVIPEESEKNSSEEPTVRNDTIVMDLFNTLRYPEGDVTDGQKARTNTVAGNFNSPPTEMRAPQREQTITEQMKPILEQMQSQKVTRPVAPVKAAQGQQTLQEQILDAQSRLKKTPVRPEETKQFPQVNPIKPVTSPAQPPQKQGFPTLKPLKFDPYQQNEKSPMATMSGLASQSSVQQVLNSKRQSILTTNQVEKLLKPSDGFLGNLPKLKPVATKDKNQVGSKSTISNSVSQSAACDFKQETAIQKAIRKIQEQDNNNSDDESEMSFSFS